MKKTMKKTKKEKANKKKTKKEKEKTKKKKRKVCVWQSTREAICFSVHCYYSFLIAQKRKQIMFSFLWRIIFCTECLRTRTHAHVSLYHTQVFLPLSRYARGLCTLAQATAQAQRRKLPDDRRCFSRRVRQRDRLERRRGIEHLPLLAICPVEV